MKIVLLSNYLPDQQESMIRYARWLDRSLRERGHEVRVIHPPARLLPLLRGGGSAALRKWVAYVDKYLLAPRFLTRQIRDADLVHICDHSNSMYLRLVRDAPSIITCHDVLAVLAAEGRFSGVQVGSTGRLLQGWIARNLLRASSIVTVSHKTAEDLQELARAQAYKPAIAVIHNPIHWDYHPVPRSEAEAALRTRGLPAANEYLVHIGSNSWYKNRPAVVRIFAMLKRESARFANTHLLLAGKPADEELKHAIARSGVSGQIHKVENPSDEELRALYSNALALLYPSREEGFGWPIIEAQACGCLVVTTARAPMCEVAGDGAILIDPEQPEMAAATIAALEPQWEAIRARGLANAQRFAPERAIERYLDLYRQTIAAVQGA